MIDPKDWKKYRDQVRLYNEMKWADANAAQAKLIKDHAKREEERRSKAHEIAARTGTMPFYLPSVMCGMILPYTMPLTVEGCLNWIADGRPTLARKVKVKSI